MLSFLCRGRGDNSATRYNRATLLPLEGRGTALDLLMCGSIIIIHHIDTSNFIQNIASGKCED
jgi:hypothetical protein